MPKWNNDLRVIQAYFTCEGRYNRAGMYHFKFLAYLVD